MSPRLKKLLAAAFALIALAGLVGVAVSLRESWNSVQALDRNSPGDSGAVDMNASDNSARVSDDTSALYRVTFNGIPIEEVERGETYSYIESGIAVDPLVISSLESRAYPGDIVSFERLYSNAPAIIELACLRDFDYYLVLAETGRPGFYVHFTNDEETPIRELLGDRYSANAQKQFDADGYRRAPHVGISGTESCMGSLALERP